MKETKQDTAQLAVLTQKVRETRQALEELKEDKNAKLQSLLNFFQHLSLACKGQNLELDNKLAKLRRQLTHVDTIEEALPEMLEVERLLKRQHSIMTKELEEGRTALTRMTQQLQRIKSHPEQQKKELSYFRQDLSIPFHSVWDYIPKTERMLSFYEELLAHQFQDETSFDLEPRHQQLARELSGMMQEIDFPQPQRDQMLVLQEQLEGEVSGNTLVEAYQTVLSQLLDNINHEKSASREFLFALNDALTAVQAVVDESAEHHGKHHEIKSRLNAAISHQMAGMGKSVQESQDLDQLKQQVTEQLSHIQEALSRKEALEQREHALMQKSMDSMQKELTELSREASSYKERLFEQQQLNQLDPLTQLPNRAALEEKMEQAFHKFTRNGQAIWLAVVDIDHFKHINDEFGHSTGDKTLQVIAMALKNALRDTEFVARYGGEEFVLIIPEVSEYDINQLLNRVREKIKSIPFKFKNQRITVTVSIGAAQMSANETTHETFDRADVALYQAKNTSRDKVVVDV